MCLQFGHPWCSVYASFNSTSRDDLAAIHAELLGALSLARFDECTDRFYDILIDANVSPLEKAALIRGMCKLRIKVRLLFLGVFLYM